MDLNSNTLFETNLGLKKKNYFRPFSGYILNTKGTKSIPNVSNEAFWFKLK